jgi:hypothetical protein
MREYPRLSAARIKATQPIEHDVWLSDSGGWRGFGQLQVRITPRGTRRFYFRYTEGGHRRTIVLGPYNRNQKPGFLTLNQARALAVEYATSITARGFANLRTSSSSSGRRSQGPIDSAPAHEPNH